MNWKPFFQEPLVLITRTLPFSLRVSTLTHHVSPTMWFRAHHRALALDVFNKWHVVFLGTRIDSVKAILECDDLLISGMWRYYRGKGITWWWYDIPVPLSLRSRYQDERRARIWEHKEREKEKVAAPTKVRFSSFVVRLGDVKRLIGQKQFCVDSVVDSNCFHWLEFHVIQLLALSGKRAWICFVFFFSRWVTFFFTSAMHMDESRGYCFKRLLSLLEETGGSSDLFFF